MPSEEMEQPSEQNYEHATLRSADSKSRRDRVMRVLCCNAIQNCGSAAIPPGLHTGSKPAKHGRWHPATRRASPVFPTPGSRPRPLPRRRDGVAEGRCLERGQRLTPIRRKVLAALLASHKPLGAYDIIEGLAPAGARPAPITAYRALEFLRENGLVHRIASRNAFVACVHNHAAADLVVFLICEGCGVVGEASSPKVAATLTSAAHGGGLYPESPVIEIAASAPIAWKARRLARQFEREVDFEAVWRSAFAA